MQSGLNYIEVKTSEVKHIINATFPDYRKKKVLVWPATSVTLHDLNWSGGTKSEYRACSVDGKSNGKHVDTGRPAPWNNPYEGLTIPLPIDCVVAKAGYFCGKPSTMYLYIHPENMPKYLTV